MPKLVAPIAGFADERWATVPDHPDYEISDLGRVRAARPRKGTYVGRMLGTRHMPAGYRLAIFIENGEETAMALHRLVYSLFCGAIPSGYHVHHINGNLTDNRAANLQALTPRDHIHLAIPGGKVGCAPGANGGERNGMSKLTDEEVREIRRLRRMGRPAKQLAQQYGINRNYVYDLAAGNFRAAASEV